MFNKLLSTFKRTPHPSPQIPPKTSLPTATSTTEPTSKRTSSPFPTSTPSTPLSQRSPIHSPLTPHQSHSAWDSQVSSFITQKFEELDLRSTNPLHPSPPRPHSLSHPYNSLSLYILDLAISQLDLRLTSLKSSSPIPNSYHNLLLLKDILKILLSDPEIFSAFSHLVKECSDFETASNLASASISQFGKKSLFNEIAKMVSDILTPSFFIGSDASTLIQSTKTLISRLQDPSLQNKLLSLPSLHPYAPLLRLLLTNFLANPNLTDPIFLALHSHLQNTPLHDTISLLCQHIASLYQSHKNNFSPSLLSSFLKSLLSPTPPPPENNISPTLHANSQSLLAAFLAAFTSPIAFTPLLNEFLNLLYTPSIPSQIFSLLSQLSLIPPSLTSYLISQSHHLYEKDWQELSESFNRHFPKDRIHHFLSTLTSTLYSFIQDNSNASFTNLLQSTLVHLSSKILDALPALLPKNNPHPLTKATHELFSHLPNALSSPQTIYLLSILFQSHNSPQNTPLTQNFLTHFLSPQNISILLDPNGLLLHLLHHPDFSPALKNLLLHLLPDALPILQKNPQTLLSWTHSTSSALTDKNPTDPNAQLLQSTANDFLSPFLSDPTTDHKLKTLLQQLFPHNQFLSHFLQNLTSLEASSSTSNTLSMLLFNKTINYKIIENIHNNPNTSSLLNLPKLPSLKTPLAYLSSLPPKNLLLSLLPNPSGSFSPPPLNHLLQALFASLSPSTASFVTSQQSLEHITHSLSRAYSQTHPTSLSKAWHIFAFLFNHALPILFHLARGKDHAKSYLANLLLSYAPSYFDSPQTALNTINFLLDLSLTNKFIDKNFALSIATAAFAGKFNLNTNSCRPLFSRLFNFLSSHLT